MARGTLTNQRGHLVAGIERANWVCGREQGGACRRQRRADRGCTYMGAISRYVVRTTFGAFAMVLVSLTAIVWVTHALREIDVITNQGQTVLVFIGLTGLLIPMLVLVIAPVALVIAV